VLVSVSVLVFVSVLGQRGAGSGQRGAASAKRRPLHETRTTLVAHGHEHEHGHGHEHEHEHAGPPVCSVGGPNFPTSRN
jgi:ABC-type nickel/cobalt efflux system permease component RcnA